MLRLLTTLGLVAALATPAAADTDWGAYKSFVGTRCESPKTMADMVEGAKSFPVFHDHISSLKLLIARTVRATATALVCRVRISIVYNGAGQQVSGTFAVHIFKNGAWRASFD